MDGEAKGPNRKRRNSSIAGGRSPKSEKKSWDAFWNSPEILEQILRKLDFERLKVCRSVCKLWNEEICRLMWPTTTGQHNGYDTRFLEVLKQGKALQLPSPFKTLELVPDMFIPVSSMVIVRQLKSFVAITKMTLLTSDVSPTPKIGAYAMQLLRNCSKSLMELEIQYWDTQEWRPKPALKLPLLTRLSLRRPMSSAHAYYQYSPTEMDESNFFKTIISSSPNLERLKLDLIKSTLCLLEIADLRTIQALSFQSFHDEGNDGRTYRQLMKVKIDSLKELNLALKIQDTEDLEAAVAHFSHSLERLSIKYTYPQDLPFLPKLTHLEVVEFAAKAVGPSLLPALKSLKFQHFHAAGVDVKLLPFPNVKEVGFAGVRRPMQIQGDEDEAGMNVNSTVMRQMISLFPNATSWTVPHNNLTDFTPIASELKLSVELLKVTLLESYDRIFRTMRIRDVKVVDTMAFSTLHQLPGLKELQLFNAESLAKNRNLDVKSLDFSKLPNLKTLCHYGKGFNGYLCLKKRLKHLDSVVVVYDCEADAGKVEENFKFLKPMPNLKFDCKSVSLVKNRIFSGKL